MPKNKRTQSLLDFVKVYGINAMLGFGLGIGIVFFSLMLLGQNGLQKSTQLPPTLKPSPAKAEASAKDPSQTPDTEPSALNSEPLSNSRFTVLLIGMDNRPNEKYLSNTDSLVVASIDPTHQRLTFLSIPRDTQVTLPGFGVQKINSVARLQKGFPSTQKYIEGLIGFPINGYVATNFNGFKSVIDSLGGITVTIEKDMYYDTGDTEDRFINLKKGTQRLSGSQALQYARFRNDEMADITRTARQQAVLKAVFSEATSIKNLPKLPLIIPQVYRAVQTDLSIAQIWSLAGVLNKAKEYQTVSQTLPGRFVIEKGISYWKVNTNQAPTVASLLFREGKTTSVFSDNPVKQPVISKDKKNQGMPQKPNPVSNPAEKKEVKPEESKPEESKPMELKPMETKPASKQEPRPQQELPDPTRQEIQFEIIKN